MYIVLISFLVLCIWLLTKNHLYRYFNIRVNDNTSTFVITPLFVLSAIFCTLSYLKYDAKAYDYGLDCAFCNKELPYQLKPTADRYHSFTLLDEGGFELVGIGFRYHRSSFKIRSFLGYGYNENSVVVKGTDSLDNIKYLVSYETGNNNKNNSPEISFKDLSSTDFEQTKETYYWVELDEDSFRKISLYRTLSLIGIVLSLLVIVRSLFKLRVLSKSP
jgi:hypothetical protein